MLKTMRDLFSIRRTILYLIAVMILVFAASGMLSSEDGVGLSEMTLAMQNQMVMGLFIILSFMWLAGIPLAMLAAETCGDSISKEDQDGTLLLLVSKPVARSEIILGKFMAFVLTTLLLEIIVLLLSPVIMSAVMGIDIYIFNNMLTLIPSIFIYSIFVTFIFGAIATAFSAIFRSWIKTMMILVGIIILVFFGFMMLRTWLGPIYETYYLNFMDVNYHLGNAYLFFVESSGVKLIPTYQGIMGQFTGTYDAADIGKLFDRDTGAMPPALPPKNYYTPMTSIIIWAFIALALLALGMLKFQKKEIS
jgi:ABC-type transport system involved in multi-copper enzyme maturation permease subunit